MLRNDKALANNIGQTHMTSGHSTPRTAGFIKRTLRYLGEQLVGLPGVKRHLYNLEFHCNSRMDLMESKTCLLQQQTDALQAEVARLKVRNQLLEAELEGPLLKHIPNAFDFFTPPDRYIAGTLADDLLPATILNELQDARVLELMCGGGATSRLLKERGVREYMGLDTSPVLLEFARRHAPHIHFRFELLEREVLDKHAGSGFDLILIFHEAGRFSIAGILEQLHIATSLVKDTGTIVFRSPHPLADLLEMGLDPVDCLRSHAEHTHIEGNLLVASGRRLQHVANS